jgi:hypothetical protein
MNGYNFEFAVSAQISARVVEEMVRKVVEEQTGKKIAKLEMRTRTVTRGIGPMESNEIVFDGCTVFFENESTVSGSKTFTKETYEPK